MQAARHAWRGLQVCRCGLQRAGTAVRCRCSSGSGLNAKLLHRHAHCAPNQLPAQQQSRPAHLHWAAPEPPGLAPTRTHLHWAAPPPLQPALPSAPPPTQHRPSRRAAPCKRQAPPGAVAGAGAAGWCRQALSRPGMPWVHTRGRPGRVGSPVLIIGEACEGALGQALTQHVALHTALQPARACVRRSRTQAARGNMGSSWHCRLQAGWPDGAGLHEMPGCAHMRLIWPSAQA